MSGTQPNESVPDPHAPSPKPADSPYDNRSPKSPLERELFNLEDGSTVKTPTTTTNAPENTDPLTPPPSQTKIFDNGQSTSKTTSDARTEQTKREAIMANFDKLLTRLQKEVSKLETLQAGSLQTSRARQDYVDKHYHAQRLHVALINCRKDFVDCTIDAPEFKDRCNKAICQTVASDGLTVKSVLEKQPVFNQILRDLVDFILSLTLILPVAARFVSNGDAQPSWRPTSIPVLSSFFKPAKPEVAQAVEAIELFSIQTAG